MMIMMLTGKNYHPLEQFFWNEHFLKIGLLEDWRGFLQM